MTSKTTDMRLEDQISNPSQSIQLYDLGVRNPSALWWWDSKHQRTAYNDPALGFTGHSAIFAQHTAAEMEVMLPSLADREQAGGYTQVAEDRDAAYNRYWLAQWLATDKQKVYRLQGPTSAHVRAELLIYLLTAGIQTAHQVNERYEKFCELAAKRAVRHT